MARVVVISNHIPTIGTDRVPPDGSWASGLQAILQEQGGIWLGWDGETASVSDKPVAFTQAGGLLRAAIALSEREVAGYHDGFAQRVLWPLLHERADLIDYDPADFALYQTVNEKFAARAKERLQSEDVVWVHGYHLLPLGRRLRQLGASQALGFFLHTPFPEPPLWAVLPCHRELIAKLAAYDLVGFQTERDERNFRDYVTGYLGATLAADGRICIAGRSVRTGTFPVGVDAARMAASAASSRVRAMQARLRSHFGEQQVIAAVDHLDFNAGLPQRLRAFDRFLADSPQRRGHCALVQITAPSQDRVPECGVLADAVAQLSTAINGRRGALDWSPVRYLQRSFSRNSLMALYRFSRVGLVTPLRDGMNLVAKDYIAAQDAADPGVLVLSCFAGAACQLDAALQVNPYDINAVAQALGRALDMPRNERLARWAALWHAIRKADLHDWQARFVTALRQSRSRIRPGPWRPALAASGRLRRPVPATLTVGQNTTTPAVSKERLTKSSGGNPYRR